MDPTPTRFVVCVSNEDRPASLEVRKLYPVVPDAPAETRGLLRVIDESGESYLYPAEYFAEVELPVAIARAFREAL